MDTLPPQRRLQDLLREMRLETKLSLAKMARAAGFAAPNSYGHYESKKFKEAEIPIRHRQGIGDALFVRGISLERIRQLGPFTPSRAKAPQPAELNGRIDALTSEVAELRDAVQLLLKRTEQLERRRPKAG